MSCFHRIEYAQLRGMIGMHRFNVSLLLFLSKDE
jgi:hypothetical protein